MSADVEQRMESFLEELLYLNPYSEFKVLEEVKTEERGTHQGKIKKSSNDNITSQEEWRKLEKSLEKLKEVSKRRTPLNEDEPNRIRDSQKERSVSFSKRRKIFH